MVYAATGAGVEAEQVIRHLILATLIAFATVAQAKDAQQAAWWHTACAAPDGSAQQIFCMTYIRGAFDMRFMMIRLNPSITQPLPMQFCPPNGATYDQMRLVWVKWLDEHPERHHEAAMTTLTVALNRAFPCKQ